MKIPFEMFLFAAFFAGFAAGGEVAVDLSGEWRLTGADTAGKPITCPAVVPGDVQSALLAADIIPDPLCGRAAATGPFRGNSTLTSRFFRHRR